MQQDILIWITSLQNPILNGFAAIFTFMGNEEFYILLLPLVYWCISKTIGFRLFYILVVSDYVNSWIKIMTAHTRPIGVDGVNSIFVQSAEVGSHYPHDSFPSSHAQASTTFWGFLGYIVNKAWFWGICVAFILLISISRLYAGLHWPIDIVVGIILGVIIIVIGLKVSAWIGELPLKMKWILAIVFPLLLMGVFTEEEGIKYASFLLGAGVAYLLESQYVRMSLKTAIWKKAIAFIIGIIGIVAIQVGLKQIFPEHMAADIIRYTLMGLWGIGGAPWVFVKLGLYRSEQTKAPLQKPPVSM